jgi:kynurenine formamidase
MRVACPILAGFAAAGVVLAVTAGCQQNRASQAARPLIDPDRVIDLTYPLDDSNIYWPNAKPFHYQRDAGGPTPGGYWYAAGSFSASEHGGTHIDSPVHFAEGKATVDEILLGRLIAPAMLIDITAACAQNRDYELRIEDITEWERIHGRIPDGAAVLVRTGWSKYWPDKKQYLGSDVPGDVSHLHFPGISQNAAEFLAGMRKIYGVGIDTASLDPGTSKTFMAHRILAGARIYGLENVANLDKVPAAGATLIALPMKIRGGTGGPTRIIAILP